MIRAVIFDIGGVLAYDVWEHLLLDTERGVASICDLDVKQVRTVGQDLWNKFAYRATTGEEDWQDLEKEYWNTFIRTFNLSSSVNDFIKLTDKFILPIDGMTQLLEQLQLAGIDLAICSNNTEFWFKRQMDKLGLRRFFSPSRIVLSSRIGVPKSSPRYEMFQAVVDALQVDKDVCIFVDDREENILRAFQFGLAGIIFPSHSAYGSKYLQALLEKMGVFESIRAYGPGSASKEVAYGSD